jgi:hypothetical protein
MRLHKRLQRSQLITLYGHGKFEGLQGCERGVRQQGNKLRTCYPGVEVGPPEVLEMRHTESCNVAKLRAFKRIWRPEDADPQSHQGREVSYNAQRDRSKATLPVNTDIERAQGLRMYP